MSALGLLCAAFIFSHVTGYYELSLMQSFLCWVVVISGSSSNDDKGAA